VTRRRWPPVFGLVATMDVATGLLALLVLKRMRRHWMRGVPEPPPA